jgi:hypothetical protein
MNDPARLEDLEARLRRLEEAAARGAPTWAVAVERGGYGT